MWLLLDCIQDKSLVIITQEDVTVGTASIEEGDTVQFRIANRNKKTKWTGIILARSENRDDLVERRKAIQAKEDDQKKMQAAEKLKGSTQLPPKRLKKDVTRYSPSKSDNHKDSKSTKKRSSNKEKRDAEQRANQAKSKEMDQLFGTDSETEHSSLDDHIQEKVVQKQKQLARATEINDQSSPTKDELKKKLADTVALLKASQAGTSSQQTSEFSSKKRIIRDDSDDETVPDMKSPDDQFDTEVVLDTALKENSPSISPQHGKADETQTLTLELPMESF